MVELEEFLALNHIEGSDLFSALHMDIRETILKAVCENLKKDKDFFSWAKRVYFSTDDLEATRRVIARSCGCRLSERDTRWMNDCIKAFFGKYDSRQLMTQAEKEVLLQTQGGRCALCGCPITVKTMHADHMIPWDYVGDNLENNYQALCRNCNLSKSKHVAKAVANLITYRREAK